ncbi:glycosyltransferase family 4 protein [Candidatus Woesebacteria bacterium]|jgi:glycosyltransferase involved in cell wall biosynthesis|nr:glycosyltransferase family 4 protein [Candidatus Woesebacteria bacterium]
MNIHTNGNDRYILYTIDDFQYGGVTTFVKQYTSMASLSGYQSVVVGFSGDIPNPKALFPHSIVIEIPRYIIYGFFGRLISFFRYRQAIQQLYKKYTFETIHFSTTWSTLYTYTIKKTWQTKNVITFYGLYHKEFISLFGDKPPKFAFIKSLLIFMFQRLSLFLPNTIITFSTFAKQQIHSSFGIAFSMKTTIIPGTIIPSKFTPHRKQPRAPFTIVNLGRAELRKGISLLLEACRLLINKDIDFQALIASPIVYYKNNHILEIYEHLQLFSRVHLLHAANTLDKIRLLRQADVFVMPSIKLETFGMTVLESLQAGVPVIATPIGALSEILRKVDKRLICKTTTPKSLADQLMWYYQLSTKEKNVLRRKSWHVVHTYYNHYVWKNTLKQIYQNLST